MYLKKLWKPPNNTVIIWNLSYSLEYWYKHPFSKEIVSLWIAFEKINFVLWNVSNSSCKLIALHLECITRRQFSLFHLSLGLIHPWFGWLVRSVMTNFSMSLLLHVLVNKQTLLGGGMSQTSIFYIMNNTFFLKNWLLCNNLFWQ